MRFARSLTLYFLRACGAFALAKYLTRRDLRIICYHGFSVRDEHEVSPYMFMRRETFERRMAILAKHRIPVIPLDQAVRQLLSGQITHAETVITFDDGWATNLTIGLPILKKHAYPVCIYVTTEHLAGVSDVFNVALHYMLHRTSRVSLTLSGIHPEIDGDYELRDNINDTVSHLISIAERIFTPRERHSLLLQIARLLDMQPDQILIARRFSLMSAEEIALLSREGVEIELHTHNHRLPDDAIEAAATEIKKNQEVLFPIIGRIPIHFCYPSGKHSVVHPRWLADLGIKSATTCDSGFNSKSANPLLLKRYLDSEFTPDIEFEAEIVGIREILRRLRSRFRLEREPTRSASP